MTTKLNETQRKILTYLADPVRTEPVKMLEDFAKSPYYMWSEYDGSSATLEIFKKYLDENPRSFCESGIKRARTALGIKKEFKKGDPISSKDIKDLKAGSVVLTDGKVHMVTTNGGVVRQDGVVNPYSTDVNYTIDMLVD